MSEIDKYKTLQNISVADAIKLVLENSKLHIYEPETRDIYYTAQELISLYPNIFSKYKLDKYIKEEGLPVIKDGKERFFLKSNVEKWLEQKNTRAMFRSV